MELKKTNLLHPLITIITTIVIVIKLCSCNYKNEIPFPAKDLAKSQPITTPLVFSDTLNLIWDTSINTIIKPIVKPLNINALPVTKYDTNNFIPFYKPTEEVHFYFDKLSETDLNLEKLSSKPLLFNTSVLPPPITVKALAPTPQKGKPISILDFGSIHGLSAKFTSVLFKDKTGFLWIAGDDGLYRYDGEQIQNIFPDLKGNMINAIAEDNNGNIWFNQPTGISMIDMHNGTISISNKVTAFINDLTKISKDKNGNLWVYNNSDKAVSIINPENNTFKNISQKEGLSDSTVFEIIHDEENSIWITTNTHGINIINPTTGKLKSLKQSDGLSNDSVRAIYQDKSGKIWVSANGGILNAIDTKSGTIKHFNTLKDNRSRYAFSIFEDNNGMIWRLGFGGVEVIDTKNELTKLISKNNGLAGFVSICNILDNKNRMWIATNQGINIIDQNAATVHTLPNTQIISLMEDYVGNLWVATRNGIQIINPAKNEMRLLNTSNGLSNEFVQSISKYDNKIFITTNGGYNVIDPIHNTIEKVGKNEGLYKDTLYSLTIDHSGNTWLTGPNNGVTIIYAKTKKTSYLDKEHGLSDNNVSDVKQDKEGLFWVATAQGGVNVLDTRLGTIKTIKNEPGLKDTCNKTLLIDKTGKIWVGTDKGVYMIDKNAGTISTITKSEGLSDNIILSLQEYNGSVYAGAFKGVSVITPPNTKDSLNEWKISMLDKSESLIKETNSWNVDYITQKGQYLWGDNGIKIINRIQPTYDSAVTYFTGINIMTQPQNFSNKLTLQNKDTIWTSDSFFTKGQKPLFTGYNSQNDFSWDSVIGPYNTPVNLSIPYNNNYLQFRFSQLNLNKKDTTKYSYILEGIDKNWSTPTANTISENYLNLPPGHYTFKVCSKGINSNWSLPAIFSFTISPPWYKTWWAYLLFALLFIGIIRAYIVYRSGQLKKENKILEEKVELRTEQLQKSLEDLKATQSQLIQSEKMASLGELTAGIAHEIQNPLNFINNFSEVNTELIEEMQEEIAKGNMEEVKLLAKDIAANEQKINHHGKRADGIVKGMLLHSRTGNRQKEPTDINKLADEYLRLAYHGLRAKDKSFNASMKTEFDESLGNINVISQDIGRVILNLITNAFYAVTDKKKNTQENYEPTVTVITKKLGNIVEVRVLDNGNGIPDKVIDKIFQPFFTTKPSGEGTGLGLSLSYDIIKAHGGELSVNNIKDNAENKGAEFIITLPI